MIAPGEKSVHVELVGEPCRLSRFECDALLEARYTDRQPSIPDSRMVDVDNGFG